MEYNRIKAALAENSKTNKELAKHLRVSEGTVSDWCTNKNQPRISTLYEIARFLNMNIRELLINTIWDGPTEA